VTGLKILKQKSGIGNFKKDVQNGKLDKLAKQAIKEFQEGKCTKL